MEALWIDLQQPLDDIEFQLVLYLHQERLLDLDLTPDVFSFLKHYMGQFKYAVTTEERELLPEKRFQLDRGGSGFTQMVRNYAVPEDWRAPRRYIAKTLHGRWASAVREAVGQSQHHSSLSPEEAEAAQQQKRYGHPRKPKRSLLVPHDSQDQQLYGVDEIVRILEAEAAEGTWVPSRDTLYDWGNAGLFAWHRDERQRKCLDEDGVNEIRARVEAERAHRNLIRRAKVAGMSPSAIKKAN
jgi:hypothetical protein